jgi:hypothetical protein
MFHGSRRCIAIVAATSIGILAAACGGTPASTTGEAPPAPAVAPATNPGIPAAPIAGQQLHSTRTAKNYSALDRGILIYTPLKTLQTGVPVELSITVIDIGRGPQLTSAPTIYHGEAVDPYDIATSAEVAVQIICTSDLICQSQTRQDSQFVSLQHEGGWVWRLTAQNPGTALIGIMAVTYERGSDAFVHTTPLWTISLNVQAA